MMSHKGGTHNPLTHEPLDGGHCGHKGGGGQHGGGQQHKKEQPGNLQNSHQFHHQEEEHDPRKSQLMHGVMSHQTDDDILSKFGIHNQTAEISKGGDEKYDPAHKRTERKIKTCQQREDLEYLVEKVRAVCRKRYDGALATQTSAQRGKNSKFTSNPKNKGLAGMRRGFHNIMDRRERKGVYGHLDKYEFENAMLNVLQVPLEKEECQRLFDYFDSSNDGQISWTEFAKALREPMSQSTLALIKRIFDALDSGGEGEEIGFITAGELRKWFDAPATYSQCRNGDMSENKGFAKFMEAMGDTRDRHGNPIPDGLISWCEWLDHYSDMYAEWEYGGDHGFRTQITHSWHRILENEHWLKDQETAAKRLAETKAKLGDNIEPEQKTF